MEFKKRDYILITGATGNFRNATIDSLLKKGARLGTIAALVREKIQAVDLLSKGIILRIGDFDNYTSLVDAFEGVDKLLLVSEIDFENREKQHEKAIQAAKEAGVRQIYYTRYESNNEMEMAEATANILMSEGHNNKEYYFSTTGNITCVNYNSSLLSTF
jgi:NAD(P)H dehydrogenase (quinone)